MTQEQACRSRGGLTRDGNGAPKPENPMGTRLKWGGSGKNLDPPNYMGRVWVSRTHTRRPAYPPHLSLSCRIACCCAAATLRAVVTVSRAVAPSLPRELLRRSRLACCHCSLVS